MVMHVTKHHVISGVESSPGPAPEQRLQGGRLTGSMAARYDTDSMNLQGALCACLMTHGPPVWILVSRASHDSR